MEAPSEWFGLCRRCGDIESIRVLHERFCAFVNFKSADTAAHAMEKLNVGPDFVREPCLFSHPVSPDATSTCF